MRSEFFGSCVLWTLNFGWFVVKSRIVCQVALDEYIIFRIIYSFVTAQHGQTEKECCYGLVPDNVEL